MGAALDTTPATPGPGDRLGTWEDDAVDRLVGPVPRAVPIEVQCAILRSMLRQERLLAELIAVMGAKAPAPVRPPPVPARR